ncbi:MAG: bis(5'-nucleosyl)-tetraphosphatase (symmetrical) YqeK [Oscillospiraceae bacterium]|nr:bis(5'-nucleosyl)-tetraphosphatase (symmetrical) YqeK [Oscillospiraceae bacterium]
MNAEEREYLDFMRAKAHALLKEKRIKHVEGVEALSAALAKAYGEDEYSARLAAMFHDCAKKMSLEEQLRVCEKYGYEPDKYERESESLLHSKAGALIARYEYIVPAEVSEAIKWHTTGKENMTKLEKIIYLADMIEPTRDFPGVDEIRKEAARDLDAAVVMALERTIDHCRERGLGVHPNSVKALEFLKKERKQ